MGRKTHKHTQILDYNATNDTMNKLRLLPKQHPLIRIYHDGMSCLPSTQRLAKPGNVLVFPLMKQRHQHVYTY